MNACLICLASARSMLLAVTLRVYVYVVGHMETPLLFEKEVAFTLNPPANLVAPIGLGIANLVGALTLMTKLKNIRTVALNPELTFLLSKVRSFPVLV